MKAFGFLSFGHYGPGRGSQTVTAKDSLLQAIDLAAAAEEIGVNGAYFRVHHFATQQAAPIPLLSAIAARTSRIEVGTGVIDLRYENPLYLAEEAAALDLISDGRLALGMSRGSPETAERGYEAFGYTGTNANGEDPKGATLAREKFELFLAAIDGEGVAPVNRSMNSMGSGILGSNSMLRVEPHSPSLRKHVWWGSGTRETAEWAGTQGVNLMSSTLLTEDGGVPFHELQAEQIRRYRQAWQAAGHQGTPRVSVSRSIFPITSDLDRLYFGQTDRDQVGVIDGLRSTFGKSYAAEPDRLVEELLKDTAIAEADTLMLTVPTQLGVEYNAHVLSTFAEQVAPALGWKPNTEGPVEGYPI
ncbi:LLM class flavin-dependent oxidoreductase [Psychromicrobium xiongbiense]|uniref:LLM class flavin-dependent oxidoreductase n=1 Tax=Psychromicrobium xiongbiense TaxID=3051184 RepID=UPI002557509B|nr:LLM class flavin-dependent oxidoreductase [Psychromicrobium sp. YIM S02556]